MADRFRIHGDNIVECERIVSIILCETKPISVKITLLSPSTIVYNIQFRYYGCSYLWQLELLPGFNKANRRRWQADIFSCLKANGSFLNETPDAIVTRVENGMEAVLYAIEFCSALQAGNQAWQRNGRALSTGRTGCPYLYVVDFVNYELKAKTRKRKTLRFPNPAVPYSYINFSEDTGNFVAQIYTRSVEFNRASEPKIRDFDESNFGEAELSRYIVKRMCGVDTIQEEKTILQKSLNVVQFLAGKRSEKTNFTPKQWMQLYESQEDIIQFSLKHSEFNFQKKISCKGHHGNSLNFLELVGELSIGLASRDWPLGIIPAKNRREFANGMQRLYPSCNTDVINRVAENKVDLILCMIKGFKPGGDDNRPDRGILPLSAMLSSADIEVMTYIYGPVIERSYKALNANYEQLADANGFWKSVLTLSDFIVLDAPVLSRHPFDAEVFLDTSVLKKKVKAFLPQCGGLVQAEFSGTPQNFHEDDVDTGIHYLFVHCFRNVCFEGMCNPPGGDWSALTVQIGKRKLRWLSLPRVSKAVNGKRPDHVLELFDVFDCPVLLVIESKERSLDLEQNVGNELVNYLRNLMDYMPNVERVVKPYNEPWVQSERFVDFHSFKIISAAAYLKKSAQPNGIVLDRSQCDMLFIMEPIERGWNIEIVTATRNAKILKKFICDEIEASGSEEISVF